MESFTGFVFQKLDKRDLIILLILAISLLTSELSYFKILNFESDTINAWVCVFWWLLPWWFMDVRFRNLIFSAIWLILTTQYFLLVHLRDAITLMPLIGFLSFHTARLIFWWMYHREFIPSMLGMSHYYGRYSRLLKSTADGEDGVCSVLLFFGLIILWQLLVERRLS